MHDFFDAEDWDDFANEALMLLDRAEQLLLRAEKAGDLKPIMKELRRDFHTFKGNLMILEADSMALMVHKLEDLLISPRIVKLEEGRLARLVDYLLSQLDFYRERIEKKHLEVEESELAKQKLIIDVLTRDRSEKD